MALLTVTLGLSVSQRILRARSSGGPPPVLEEHKHDVDSAETLTAPIRVVAHHDLAWPEADRYFRSLPARHRFESLSRPEIADLVDHDRQVERAWSSGPVDAPLVVRWPPADAGCLVAVIGERGARGSSPDHPAAVGGVFGQSTLQRARLSRRERVVWPGRDL